MFSGYNAADGVMFERRQLDFFRFLKTFHVPSKRLFNSRTKADTPIQEVKTLRTLMLVDQVKRSY